MLFYIIVLLLLFSSLGFKKNIYVFAILYLFLLFLGGLRGVDVGTDTYNYHEIYTYVNNENSQDFIGSLIEPFWIFVNKFVFYCFSDYQAVLFIGVLLAITPVFIRIWKSCDKPFWAVLFYVLLFFYFNSWNVTRQAIALSFIFYGIEYIENRNYKKFFLCVLIATGFHYSAIVCTLFPLIYKKIKLSFGLVLICLPVTFVLGLYIIPLLIPKIPFIGKYSVYLGDLTETSGSFTRFVLNIFFLIVFWASSTRNVYMLLFFVGINMYNLLAFNPYVGRIAFYFTCTQLILFSNLIFFHKSNRVIIRMVILLYGLFYYLLMLKVNLCGIIPYVLK